MAAGGRVEAIFVGSELEGPLHATGEVVVVAGRGVEGDRYYQPDSEPPRGSEGRDLTLFEAEAVEALLDEHGIELAPSQTRRNVMTRGARLNDLVGHRFRVGEVEGFGEDRCDPCNHLQALTKPGVLRGLAGRGGLRADVTRGGVIRVGDIVEDLGAIEHPATETAPA